MAPDPLASTYTRYKSSTEKFLKWLQESDPHPHPRTQARGSKQAQNKKLPVDSIIGLATAIIAATDPEVVIPLDILDTTKDVIEGRRAAAAWYRGLKDASTVSSNLTHQYFLGVIEAAFELLRKEHKARQPKRKKNVVLPTDSSDLSNVFAQLHVEETSRAFEEAPPRVRGKKVTPVAKPEEALLEEDSTEEKLFAIWCHFKDFFDLRLETRKAWKQYCKGEISFITACQVFDNAVRLVMLLTKEFGQAHPDLQTFESMMDVLGEQEYMVSARYYEFKHELVIVDDLFEEDKEQFLCMPAWCAIQDVDDLLPFIYWPPDHNSELLGQIPVSRFAGHPFSKALLQIIGDLADIAGVEPWRLKKTRDHVHILTIGDEYTRQLLRYIMFVDRVRLEPGMSSGLLAATQMYMDMYDTLDGEMSRGLQECLLIFDRHEEMVTSHRAWTEDDHLDLYTKLHVHPQSCERLEARRSLIVPGVVKNGRDGWSIRVAAEDDGVTTDCFIPLSVLETLPVLAGRAAALVSFQIQISGIEACNYQQTVLAAAHLYKAVEAQAGNRPSWPDMDFVISRENEKDQPLWRRGDESARSAAKRYGMALGLTLTQASRCTRPRLPKAAECDKKCAKLRNMSYFVTTDGAKGDWRDNLMFAHSANMNVLHQCVRYYADNIGIKDAVLSKQWTEWNKLSPVQLLRVEQEIFVEDEAYLNFDFHRFYQRCVDFLHQVCSKYLSNTDITKFHRVAQRSPRMPEIVHEILWDAAMAESGHINRKTKVLCAAEDCIGDMGRQQDDTAITDARSKSSARTLEGLRPEPRSRSLALFETRSPGYHLTPVGSVRLVRGRIQEANPYDDRFYDDNLLAWVMHDAFNERDRWTADGMSRGEVTGRLRSWINNRLYELRVPILVAYIGPAMKDSIGDTVWLEDFLKEDFAVALNSIQDSSVGTVPRRGILLMPPEGKEIGWGALPSDAWVADGL